MTLAVANAAQLGVRLGAVCADVVESLNAILKRAYNDHTSRGGGGWGDAGGYGIGTGGEVVLQAWEWWFLKSDVPLQHHGAPHTADCTMAKTHGHPKPPALLLFVPSPSSCFALSWTKKC